MCIFCQIISGEIPSKKIYEDADVFAFLDLHPVTLGHALVIPKMHATDLREVPDDIVSKVFVAAKRIGIAAVASLPAQGFNVGVNTGVAAGQVVMHAHVHVIPRTEGDGLVHWPKSQEAVVRMDEAAGKMAAALST